jgi:hypothetical protein
MAVMLGQRGVWLVLWPRKCCIAVLVACFSMPLRTNSNMPWPRCNAMAAAGMQWSGLEARTEEEDSRER